MPGISLCTCLCVLSLLDLTTFHSGSAVGQGVTQSLLRETVKVALEVSNLWQTRGPYSTLQFLPFAQERERTVDLQTCGFICLLHMVALGSGPEPVSPFLLRAIIEPREVACKVDISLLRLLSPDDFATLAPWISRDKSQRLSEDVTSKVASLLMASDIDVSCHWTQMPVVPC